MKVKLIDLGASCCVAAAVLEDRVQTLWCRAPEVHLSEATDVCSLGLVAAELALGYPLYPLYPGEHEYDLMKFIVEAQGQPADRLLNCGSQTRLPYLSACLSPEESPADTVRTGGAPRRALWVTRSRWGLSSCRETNGSEKELHRLTELMKRMLDAAAPRQV